LTPDLSFARRDWRLRRAAGAGAPPALPLGGSWASRSLQSGNRDEGALAACPLVDKASESLGGLAAAKVSDVAWEGLAGTWDAKAGERTNSRNPIEPEHLGILADGAGRESEG